MPRRQVVLHALGGVFFFAASPHPLNNHLLISKWDQRENMTSVVAIQHLTFDSSCSSQQGKNKGLHHHASNFFVCLRWMKIICKSHWYDTCCSIVCRKIDGSGH